MNEVNPYQVPHRRPVGGDYQLPPAKILPTSLPLRQQPPAPTHAHSRTVSSSIFPAPAYSQPQNTYTQTVGHNRRSASNATASTMSSQGGPGRSPSSVSITLRRSASARSGQSFVPTSYVALMRKQKATVWCDRAQHEDPRVAAQAKQAKMRAVLEVSGGNQPRTSTSTSMGSSSLGMRSKITNRHHNTAKPIGYSANLLGTTGVPMRLSASEVGDEDHSEGDDAHSQGFRGQRSGSGRSSLVNSGRLSALNQRQSGRLSTGSTPPSGQSASPAEPDKDTPLAGVNRRRTTGEDYFQHPPGNGGSGSSGEGEAKFGDIGDMEAPKTVVKEGKSAEELSRRGSVDERATTMRGAVRLFVANPDLSD